jgi:hypothetical protein
MKEVMYKLLLVICVVLLSACQQLQHGQMQPVKLIGNNKYFTSCAGAVEDWNNCYDKASATCGGKYDVITREDNNRGTYRALTFQCKK